LIGLSANNVDSHAGWIKDINNLSEGPALDFPIIADESREVSTLYGMLDNLDKTNVDKKGIPFTVRTVFVSKSIGSLWCLRNLWRNVADMLVTPCDA
jgi:alkyl hydroperoxide reductase subunit AhpC